MRSLIMGAGLLLGLVAGALAGPTQAQVDAGRRLFARCAGCHDIGPGARHGFGPQLNDVVGRKAGGAAGYAYSPALRNSRLVWNEQNLVAFVRDSEKVIPGNKMRFFSFLNEKQVTDIVAYLRVHGVAASPPKK